MYAPFFDWPDKNLKELQILKSFIESMERKEMSGWRNPHNSEEDPPDCLAEDEKGNLIAVEITELVDEKARLLNEGGKNRAPKEVYRLWETEGIVQKIKSILQNKDKKCVHIKKKMGNVKKVVLLIHTDEFELNKERLEMVLKGTVFNGLRNIDEAFLILSYDPSIEYCPILQLSF